jgi:hypothetical protein
VVILLLRWKGRDHIGLAFVVDGAIVHDRAFHSGTAEIHAAEIGTSHIGAPQVSPPQIRLAGRDARQNAAGEIRTREVFTGQQLPLVFGACVDQFGGGAEAAGDDCREVTKELANDSRGDAEHQLSAEFEDEGFAPGNGLSRAG